MTEESVIPAAPKKEFRIPSKGLTPNPYFLDILKRDLSRRRETETRDRNMFALYEGHLRGISHIFADCPEEHQFWLHSGKNLKNLKELYDELGIMSDIVYTHHVNSEKNDFAHWVKYVFKDDKLAISLNYAQSREEAMIAIEKRAEELIHELKIAKGDEVFGNVISKLKEKNSKLEEEIRKKKEWLISRHKELEEREKKALDKERELQQKFRDLERQEKELRLKITEESERINQFRTETDKQSREIAEAQKENQEQIYTELDLLIESAKTHILSGNFLLAKELIPKIRQYYSKLDKNDPKKREFWNKITELKAHSETAVKKVELTSLDTS